jgi:hypothetical protein
MPDINAHMTNATLKEWVWGSQSWRTSHLRPVVGFIGSIVIASEYGN